MYDKEKVVEALAEVARPIILEFWRQDSCIASTRLAQLALKEYYGIESHPIEVEVTAHNALSMQAHAEGHEPDWANGAWSVGVRRTEPGESKPSGWMGAHLVLLVDDILLDLSASQLDRPKKNLQADSVAVRVDVKEFLNGGGLSIVSSDEPTTQIVYFYCDPQDLTYMQAPDWKERKRFKEPMGKVIKAVNRWLETDAQDHPSAP